MNRLTYTDEGYLMLGEEKAIDLANDYQTPLYVLHEGEFRHNCRVYQEAFLNQGLKVKICYAAKALLNMTIASLLIEEGLGLDVVSGGELYMALKAGFPPENIIFNGNSKTREELELAINHKVSRIIVDNLDELDLLHSLTQERREEVSILLRINPHVGAHTHQYLQTSIEGSKFGFGIEDGNALLALDRLQGMDLLKLRGIHCHIGSQITSLEPYHEAIKKMFAFSQILRERGYPLKELDLGGGLGVLKDRGEAFIHEYASLLTKEVRDSCDRFALPYPLLLLEPGRSIIDTAITTLYQVGAVKEASGRRLIVIDGGMGDNIRPALYQAHYDALPGKRTSKEEEKVSIVGRCCESGDILIHEAFLPPLKRGDILAIPFTGAYTSSMSSNYNGFPRPAMVMIGEGGVYEIVRRETFDDLILRDRVPNFFQKDTKGRRKGIL